MKGPHCAARAIAASPSGGGRLGRLREAQSRKPSSPDPRPLLACRRTRRHGCREAVSPFRLPLSPCRRGPASRPVLPTVTSVDCSATGSMRTNVDLSLANLDRRGVFAFLEAAGELLDVARGHRIGPRGKIEIGETVADDVADVPVYVEEHIPRRSPSRMSTLTSAGSARRRRGGRHAAESAAPRLSSRRRRRRCPRPASPRRRPGPSPRRSLREEEIARGAPSRRSRCVPCSMRPPTR